MALFSGMRPQATPMPGVVPYFPTQEERATAIPAQTSPARSGGLFGAPMVRDQQPADVALTNELPATPLKIDPVQLGSVDWKAAKPGFFGKGGLGERILKGLGEWGLRYSASQGNPYALMVFRQRYEQQQATVRAQEDERRQRRERDEWTWREQWKLQHPDDQFTQYLAAAGIDPGSEQGRGLYRQRAESMAAPPLMAVDGFDASGNPTKTFMPRIGLSGPAGGSSAAAGPPVGTLRSGFRFVGGNPNERTSWVPAGGASPAGGATFR